MCKYLMVYGFIRIMMLPKSPQNDLPKMGSHKTELDNQFSTCLAINTFLPPSTRLHYGLNIGKAQAPKYFYIYILEHLNFGVINMVDLMYS